jgi:hypothetical protein
MLINLSIGELKILSESLSGNDEDEAQALKDKIDKEIEYYDFATQEEVPF